jgi:hypothetical protein
MEELSPALRHRERVLAMQAAAAAEPGGVTHGSAYELMLLKLAEDRRRLKDIQSIERKIVVKATLLPAYQDWLDGVLAAGAGGQDDVLATALVWHIDVGDYDRALQLARYAVTHKFSLPDQYSRNVATMLLDEFAGGFLNGVMAAEPAHAVDVLSEVERLTAESDAPDQARAKLHKAIAFALMKVVDAANAEDIAPEVAAQARSALTHLNRALSLFQGIGVKKEIERLERRIKRLPDPG